MPLLLLRALLPAATLHVQHQGCVPGHAAGSGAAGTRWECVLASFACRACRACVFVSCRRRAKGRASHGAVHGALAARAAAGGEQHEQSALERELAAGREVPRALSAADREQQQRVEANVRHVLRQASWAGWARSQACRCHADVFSAGLQPRNQCRPARLQFPLPVPTALYEAEAAAAGGGASQPKHALQPSMGGAHTAGAAPLAAGGGAPQQLLSAAASRGT